MENVEIIEVEGQIHWKEETKGSSFQYIWMQILKSSTNYYKLVSSIYLANKHIVHLLHTVAKFSGPHRQMCGFILEKLGGMNTDVPDMQKKVW